MMIKMKDGDSRLLLMYLSVSVPGISLPIIPVINSLRPSDAFIYVGKLTIIGSDNGLSLMRRQAITRINATLLSVGP